ncbi:GPI mannosyltransferase 2 isoform X2 [Asparagus officinalis]|uniref:GPI mannosyltransferase 2 isoform X2 n=1 Tax=Asparagus officinalis TaxID=4686 RepID=UPI00098E5BEF|nr:GPI mannosyltransferase 2 isoform X2 [Asparagus officinalis]
MTTSHESVAPVLRLAVASRLLVVTLIVLWRLLFDPYDTSASLNPPCLGERSQPSDSIRWPKTSAAIESSVVWDGVFFVRIAECGYEYEQTYAFLPLLPISMVLLSKSVFAPLVPMIGYRAVLALSGYVLNNVAFVLAAVFLYRLSILILKDSGAALRACILFCFNPASIFYSSVYSESLYALSSLGGLFYLFSGSNTVAMLLLALSGAARSNGAINAGYFCFLAMLQVCDAIIQKKRHKVVAAGIGRSLFIFSPFILFQAYGYWIICQCSSSNELRPWCKGRVPLLYGFLQSHYWGVGFLRYFQMKQLPNFLLASPVLSLAVCSVVWYTSSLFKVFQFSREGKTFASMMHPVGDNQSSDSPSQLNYSMSSETVEGDHRVRRRKKESLDKGSESIQDPYPRPEASHNFLQGYHSIMVLPFILHLGFMTFTAFFVMHVQVATRFLSASPPIYWFASYVLDSPGSISRRICYFIWFYFIGYILLGSLLFSNFYPFT